MNKKFLSAILFGALMVSSTGVFVSCKDYDDDIENLQEQINANKKAIDDINALITNGSVITNVTSSANGVVVTLSNNKTFEITNGTNGKNGTVWTIGTDGYWYKDEVKTEYKAVGQAGEDGAAGAAGNTYVPNATTGFFDIYQGDKLIGPSTISWKASGNGISAVVTDGDLYLSGVEGVDGPVVISLTNELRAMVYQPEAYVEGIPAMLYYSVAYDALKANDKMDSKDEAFVNIKDSKNNNIEVVENKGIEAKYHINPTNVNPSELQNLKFATRNVRYIQSRSAEFEATAAFKSYADGILTVNVELGEGVKDWETYKTAKDSISVMALQAVREDKDTITSDYATVYKTDVDSIRIANPKLTDKAKNHYRYAINTAIADADVVSNKAVWATQDYSDIDAELVDGSTLDLSTIVAAHGSLKDGCIDLNPETYGWKWNFSVVKNYKLGTNETPQEEFVALNGSVLSTKVYGDESAGAAVGRTPIIRVTLTNGANQVVAVAYIKVKIVKDSTPSRDAIEINKGEVEFTCSAWNGVVTVKDMNTLIYNAVGMDKLSFHNLFKSFKSYVEDEKNNVNVGTVTQVVDEAETTTSVKSYKLTWNITSEELWKNAGKEMTHTVVYYNGEDLETSTDKLFVVLKATAEDIAKSADIDAAKMLDNYWNTEKTITSYNFRTPVVGEDKINQFELITDPNASFKTVNGNLLLSEGLSAGAVTKYYFCMDDMKKIETIGDLTVKFSFADKDSVTLYAQIYNATTDKFEPETAEVVAKITNKMSNLAKENSVGTPYTSFDGGKMNSFLQYGQSAAEGSKNTAKKGNVAKRLLNTGAMYALICADQYPCAVTTNRVSVSFKGADHFRANIIRPVYAKEVANGNFIDGKDKIPSDKTLAEVGTYMSIENLVDLYDWRGRQFSADAYKSYYYGYYGILTIVPDVENATCDLNGENTAVPTTVVLDWVENETVGTDVTYGKDTDKVKNAQTSKYGFVTYYNNGAKLDKDFNLTIPVTITYAWGEIKTTVKAHVAKTEQK